MQTLYEEGEEGEAKDDSEAVSFDVDLYMLGWLLADGNRGADDPINEEAAE